MSYEAWGLINTRLYLINGQQMLDVVWPGYVKQAGPKCLNICLFGLSVE